MERERTKVMSVKVVQGRCTEAIIRGEGQTGVLPVKISDISKGRLLRATVVLA